MRVYHLKNQSETHQHDDESYCLCLSGEVIVVVSEAVPAIDQSDYGRIERKYQLKAGQMAKIPVGFHTLTTKTEAIVCCGIVKLT